MSINLLQLIPEKFHNSEIMLTLIDVLEEEVSTWTTKIAGLQQLQDPYNVPTAYLQELANHIGMVLSDSDDSTEAIRRKELIGAVDWYKTKGTYLSLNLISLWANFNFVFFDKYFDTEVNYNNGIFSDQEWFVGDENENPPGLDASWFKSPHFGLSIELNQKYNAGTYTEGVLEEHLWRPSLFVGVTDHVEKTRPINTVPSYLILHTCITDQSLTAFTITATEVITRIVGVWNVDELLFDALKVGDSGDIGSDAVDHKFDDSEFFDVALEIFIASITKWKMGTYTAVDSGEPEVDDFQDLTAVTPSGGFVIGAPIQTGTIDSYVIYIDRVEFFFTVPQSVTQFNINEIGLYRVIEDVEELMILSTSPIINKGNNTALKVKIVVYKTTEVEEFSPENPSSGNYGAGAYGAGVYGG